MIGSATSMGAISVVNALASGKGATVAVSLPTWVKVDIRPTPGPWSVSVNGKPVNPGLAEETISRTLLSEGKDSTKHSGKVETISPVPRGVGLKTSSSSSVAIALATLSALGHKEFDPEVVLGLSVESSLAAAVSVTGALDDAASCLLGGTNFADNARRKLTGAKKLGARHPVLIHVPPIRTRRGSVNLDQVRVFSEAADEILTLAQNGQHWNALTLNGLLYSSVYQYDPGPALSAIEAGALGAGLSGTGPATAAVFEPDAELERAKRAWDAAGGFILETTTTDEGAKIGV
ncbi:MAG: shikimate kinase [archaeon]|nr:MAG: shikimate kinase [archaeon]